MPSTFGLCSRQGVRTTWMIGLTNPHQDWEHPDLWHLLLEASSTKYLMTGLTKCLLLLIGLPRLLLQLPMLLQQLQAPANGVVPPTGIKKFPFETSVFIKNYVLPFEYWQRK